jgi:tyrosyl-tRNA synthetase
VAKALNELLEPIRKAYEDSPEWQEITLKAYPPPAKKEKKKKDKGSRYPGGAGKPTEGGEQAQTLPDRTV